MHNQRTLEELCIDTYMLTNLVFRLKHPEKGREGRRGEWEGRGKEGRKGIGKESEGGWCKEEMKER